MILALPGPSRGVCRSGPLPIRAYALAIIVGVIATACLALRGSRRDRRASSDRARSLVEEPA